MIKVQTIEYNEEILDEVRMTALEAQFRATIPCLNKEEHRIHRLTEILLSEIYNKISLRTTNDGCKTIQGGSGFNAQPPEGVF